MFDQHVLFAGLCVSFAEFVLAWADQSLTKGQTRRRGVLRGLPLLWHGAFWGNIVLAFWFSHLAALYGAYWDQVDWTMALIVGIVVSVLVHQYGYTQSAMAEAHVEEHRVTAAGWAQTVSMAGGIAIALLVYLPTTPRPDYGTLWGTAYLLLAYFPAANHMALPVLKRIKGLARVLKFYPGRPFQDPIAVASGLGLPAVVIALTILRVGH